MSLSSAIKVGLYGAMQVAGQSAALGAAATNLPTVSNLDLAADECYLFRFRFNNATASGGSLLFFVNGDNVNTNYYTNPIYATTAVAGGRANSADVAIFDANECCTGWGLVDRDGDGCPRITTFVNRGAPAALINLYYQMVWTGTANLTSVQLSSSIANSFSPGDYIKFYKLGAPTSLTQTDATASRALNTTYTNNRAFPITVRCSVRCAVSLASGTAYVTAKSDSASPPTTVVSGTIGIQSGLLNEDNTHEVSFLVAPGANYRVDSTAANGTVTLGKWFEIY